VLGGREGASGAACAERRAPSAERREHSEKLWSTEKASVVLVPLHCVPLRFCLFGQRAALRTGSDRFAEADRLEAGGLNPLGGKSKQGEQNQ
jgi:hypothetical protein